MRKPLFIILGLSFMLSGIAVPFAYTQAECYVGVPPSDVMERLEVTVIGLRTEVTVKYKLDAYMMVFVKVDNLAQSPTSFDVTIHQLGSGYCQKTVNILQNNTEWIRYGVISDSPVRFRIEITETGKPLYKLQATVFRVGPEKDEDKKDKNVEKKKSSGPKPLGEAEMADFVGTYNMKLSFAGDTSDQGTVQLFSNGTYNNPKEGIGNWSFNPNGMTFVLGGISGPVNGNTWDFSISFLYGPDGDPAILRLYR